MAKRQANDATNSLDKKFEIDADIFWYTSENTMAIIQQNEGVCMFSNQYYQLLELLQKKEKGTLNMGQMRIRKTKGSIMVERLDKGTSIQLKNMAVTNMQSR